MQLAAELCCWCVPRPSQLLVVAAPHTPIGSCGWCGARRALALIMISMVLCCVGVQFFLHRRVCVLLVPSHAVMVVSQGS